MFEGQIREVLLYVCMYVCTYIGSAVLMRVSTVRYLYKKKQHCNTPFHRIPLYCANLLH